MTADKPYSGPVVTRDQNPGAHGNVCVVETCACGAVRSVNVNGRHVESGEWGESVTDGPSLLRGWRRANGHTQIRAAELLGIAQPKLSDYERGVTRPELDTAVRIERVAGIPPSAWVAG